MRKEAAGDLDTLAAAADTPEERQAVANARNSVAQLGDLFEKKLLPLLNDQNKVAESMHKEAETAYQEFDATRAFTFRSTLIISLLAAVALATFAWLMIRSILAPLAEAQRVAARIAAGDLSQAIVVDRDDEFGKLLSSCEQMRVSLREIAQAIQEGSNDIASTSSQLASTTVQIAKATETQTQAASSMAASVEELSVSITHDCQNPGPIVARDRCRRGDHRRAERAIVGEYRHRTPGRDDRADGRGEQRRGRGNPAVAGNLEGLAARMQTVASRFRLKKQFSTGSQSDDTDSRG